VTVPAPGSALEGEQEEEEGGGGSGGTSPLCASAPLLPGLARLCDCRVYPLGYREGARLKPRRVSRHCCTCRTRSRQRFLMSPTTARASVLRRRTRSAAASGGVLCGLPAPPQLVLHHGPFVALQRWAGQEPLRGSAQTDKVRPAPVQG
jgi:hypothetical protein